MALGQWAIVQSGQSADLRVPSGNFLWPTIRIMNPNDGVLYIKQNSPITDSGYGSWDYKVPAQSFGILPSEGVGWQSAGVYYLDQSGTNRPGEIAMYLSMQTVAEPTFLAIGRSLVTQSSSVDIASGNQPANPGAGYGRLWIDTTGHLNVLQSSGTNYITLDSANFQTYVSSSPLGGDFYGTIQNGHINVRYNSSIGWYDPGGTVHTFLAMSGQETRFYAVGTDQFAWMNQADNTYLMTLTQAGNMTANGSISAATSLNGASASISGQIAAGSANISGHIGAGDIVTNQNIQVLGGNIYFPDANVYAFGNSNNMYFRAATGQFYFQDTGGVAARINARSLIAFEATTSNAQQIVRSLNGTNALVMWDARSFASTNVFAAVPGISAPMGFLFLTNTSQGPGAIFYLYGGAHSTNLVVNVGGFSATQNNPGTINCYWDGTQYVIQNNNASTLTISGMLIQFA